MTLPFEVEHRIHNVLEHLRAGEAAVFRHVSDENGRNVLSLGGEEELRSRFTHLSDAPGRGLKLHREDRLHRVDHDERWLQARDLLQDALDAGLREQIEGRFADAEAIAATLDLVLRLFPDA